MSTRTKGTDLPPKETRRLTFGAWQRSDVARASSLWCDPQVMRFLGGPCTEEEVRSRLDREIANGESFDVQYWPVMIGGRFAGCCGLKPHEPEQGFFELGFHFRPQFWGAGYASEAAREVIRYAFEDRGMHALFAGHHPDNDTSRSLLARLGFTRLGTHFFARTGLDHPWYRRDR